jgi:hypothetical protein
MRRTMNNWYGDGSEHFVCDECGLCVTCGDCLELGCGGEAQSGGTNST